jgi:hypothetical protein
VLDSKAPINGAELPAAKEIATPAGRGNRIVDATISSQSLVPMKPTKFTGVILVSVRCEEMRV